MYNHVPNTSYDLHVRMEMTDDGQVYFHIAPDNIIHNNLDMTPNDMASNNAPISAIATRILYHMCCDETVKSAIDVAFEISRKANEPTSLDSDSELLELPSDVVIH